MKHTLTPQRYLILLAVTLTRRWATRCSPHGMARVGPVSLAHLWPAYGGAAQSLGRRRNPLSLLGFFSASYLTALSWADLTFVLPSTALRICCSRRFSRKGRQHEKPRRPYRWLGILLIFCGVGFVANGPSGKSTSRNIRPKNSRREATTVNDPPRAYLRRPH